MFETDTQNVGLEIARIAGPQLVVPVSNARFALNAVNARWGSLFDALCGTDVIPSDEGRDAGRTYNPKRGAAVIRYAEEFLDRTVPLAEGSHTDVFKYQPVDVKSGSELTITPENGKKRASPTSSSTLATSSARTSNVAAEQQWPAP